MSEKVWIFDTTLRDGEQSPGCSMTIDEKLLMADQLDRLGVDILEAGFPVASQGDFEAVRAIAAEHSRPIIAALARANRVDIDRAWEALREAAHPRIHVFIATSDIHLKYKLRKTRSEVLKQITTTISHASSFSPEVEFSPEDAGRTDRKYLIECCHAAVEAGATVLNLPDTVGYCLPPEYKQMFTDVRLGVPGIDKVILSSHTHDDLGLAVANALAALEAGARQVECTVNGIGERAGNTSLEEIVMVLRVRKDKIDYHTETKLEELCPSSELLVEVTGSTVQHNKAIVGKNAFAHEAGIHQDGVLKNTITYEVIDPRTVGRSTNSIVLGKHSGRHALAQRYVELGYELTKPEIQRAYEKFCELADQKKKIYDDDLIGIIIRGFGSVPGVFSLKTFKSVTDSQKGSTATLELQKDGKIIHGSASATNPCEAVFRAIDRITGLKGVIEDFSVHTLDSGKLGVFEVSIVGSFEGRRLAGKASSDSVAEAAAQAYLQVSNKAEFGLHRVNRDQGTTPSHSQVG